MTPTWSSWRKSPWACNPWVEHGGKESSPFFYQTRRRKMKNWEKGWIKAEKFIVGLLAFSATLLAFYGVITRYVFKRPPDWAEEICIYMIIWAVFITASTLAAEKGHVAATLIVERFSLKTRRYLAVFNGIVA